MLKSFQRQITILVKLHGVGRQNHNLFRTWSQPLARKEAEIWVGRVLKQSWYEIDLLFMHACLREHGNLDPAQMQSAFCAISQGASRASQGCLPRSQPTWAIPGQEKQISAGGDEMPARRDFLTNVSPVLGPAERPEEGAELHGFHCPWGRGGTAGALHPLFLSSFPSSEGGWYGRNPDRPTCPRARTLSRIDPSNIPDSNFPKDVYTKQHSRPCDIWNFFPYLSCCVFEERKNKTCAKLYYPLETISD